MLFVLAPRPVIQKSRGKPVNEASSLPCTYASLVGKGVPLHVQCTCIWSCVVLSLACTCTWFILQILVGEIFLNEDGQVSSTPEQEPKM